MTHDDFFGPAYVDADEWRDRPARHRYVHGGFTDTDTRFALYFPEPAVYQGRAIQFLQGGMGGNEHVGILMGGLNLAFGHGAYYVESNQGHVGNDLTGIRGQQTVLAFRASAQAARYAKTVAKEMYGDEPHHSYVFGGSGGAMRSIACLENAADVYDGAVPFMANHGTLFNYNWSVMAFVEPVLRPVLPAIVDACDAGGTGDPFAACDTAEQREALATLYRAGFPRGGEHLIGQIPLWVLSMGVLKRADPKYFEDFWTVRGYAGADGDAVPTRVSATVVKVVPAGELPGFGVPSDDINLTSLTRAGVQAAGGIVLDTTREPASFLGARLRFADGREVLCTGAVGDVLVAVLDPVGFRGIEAGATVEVDDEEFLAFMHFHRYHVHARYPAMRQFTIDGRPLHPQRGIEIDDRRALGHGQFLGKMILVQHAQDRECWPGCVDPYSNAVGPDADERFRLWWVENASHFVPIARAGQTRLINYGGVYARAVADVIRWVEEGVEPPATVPHRITQDAALETPSTAAERQGVQPLVEMTANGAARAEVRVGEPVDVTWRVTLPPGADDLAGWDLDLDGSGSFAERKPYPSGTRDCSTTWEHTFTEPGTHMVTVRVYTERPGNTLPGLRRITNLGRARVVVR